MHRPASIRHSLMRSAMRGAGLGLALGALAIAAHWLSIGPRPPVDHDTVAVMQLEKTVPAALPSVEAGPRLAWSAGGR